MKTSLWSLVIASGLLGVMGTIEPVEATPGFVNSRRTCVNLRTAPSLGARVIACLDKGTPLTVLDDLVFNRRFGRGWMAAEFVGFY